MLKNSYAMKIKIVKILFEFAQGFSTKLSLIPFQVCNDIPVEPKCSTGRCIIGGGACPPNQAPCSRNEFNFVSSCPLQNGGAQPQTITRNKREAKADPQIRKLFSFII